MWVVYDHPHDHPDHIVVREWQVRSGGSLDFVNPPQLFDGIAAAREALERRGLHRIERAEQDDPKILELWL